METNVNKNNFVVWISGLLAALLAALFFSLTWNTGDDARYYALAKSLALGKGYVAAFLPDSPPEILTPPGHVLLLFTVMKLFGTGVLPGKVFVALTFVLASIVCSLWTRQLYPNDPFRALAAVIMGMFLLGILTMSCWYMAEMSYLVFSLLILYLYERWKEALSWPRVAALGLLTGYTYLVRSVGCSLFAGLFLFFLLKRRWRNLAVFTLGFSAIAGFWILRNWLVVGAFDTYIPHFANMTGNADGMRYPWMRIFRDISVAFPKYFGTDLPSSMFYQLLDGRNLFGLLHIGFLAVPVHLGILGLIALGFLSRLRRPQPMDLYWIFYWLLICSPPFPPQGIWYVYPVLPLAAVYLFEGITLLGALAARAGLPRFGVIAARGLIMLCAGYALATALWGGGVHAVKEIPRWQYAPWDPNRYPFFENPYLDRWGKFVEAALWVGSNRPPETVVASRQPQHVHIFTGQHGWRYDQPEVKGSNLWEQINLMAAKRPTVLIEDAFEAVPGAPFSYGTSHWALRALFEAHANDFVMIYETGEPVTRVWELKTAPTRNPDP